jgi:nitroimidazol reductase NimA-like FMN-containing flavoprotein (pyridoxamine 5'-phosphate oxidase superfamily)
MLDFDATSAMDREAIDAFLREQATGVLSLARGGDAYAIPEAFGYDGEDIYFKFGYHDESKKIQYLAHTDQAAFVVYDVADGEFRSVVAAGEVRKVPDDRVKDAIAVVDEQHGAHDPSVFAREDDEFQFAMYTLDTESISGRQSTG